MKQPTKHQWTLAGVGVVVAGVLSSFTVIVNWAVDTDKRIGESNIQRMALVQADSALFVRDSLQSLRLAKLERRAGIRVRSQSGSIPPPPKREGLFKKLAGLFW